MDYDNAAPLEPPRNLTDMARLAADRVATRLELMEMSPALRELKNKIVGLEQQLADVAHRITALEMTIDEMSLAETRRERDTLARYRLELQGEVGRVRSESFLCLLVTLTVGLILSLYFKV